MNLDNFLQLPERDELTFDEEEAKIKDIYRKYQKVLGLWQSMQFNTTFSYKHIDSDLTFNIRNRDENEIFWKKVDEDIGDVMNPKFPLRINIDGKLYALLQNQSRFIEAIETAKSELKQDIDAYNEISTDIINNAGDIERILHEPIVATEENTVVILVHCHGAYVVNSDLTIDKIPPPENKLVEIVKRAPFGFSAISDFNYSSRYPLDKRSTRYSIEDIRKKLVKAYRLALQNITILSNPTQYLSRDWIEEDMKLDPEGLSQQCGRFDESCTHVGFEYSHVPFLRKRYHLDHILSYRRDEFFRGIIFMFKDLNGNLVQYNINRIADLKFLIDQGYIQRTAKLDLLMRSGKILMQGKRKRDYKKFLLDLLKINADKVLNDGNLITSLETDFLLEIINCFQEKYTIFKIIDDSCGCFDKELSAEQRDGIYQQYGADMKCGAPLYAKGGFKKTRKRKNKFRTGRKRKTRN